jgi:hypothetical protein
MQSYKKLLCQPHKLHYSGKIPPLPALDRAFAFAASANRQTQTDETTIPLLADSSSTGTTLAQTSDHPAGTFLFLGSKTDIAGTSASPEIRTTCVNVYGKKHEGEQVYCVEKVVSSGSTFGRTHS